MATSPPPSLHMRVAQLTEAPLNLLELVPSPAGVTSWLGEDVSVVGWGRAMKLPFEGGHAMREAARVWDDVAKNATVAFEGEDVPRTVQLPVAMASFGFSDNTPGYLVVPEVTLVRDGDQVWVATAKVGGPPESPLASLTAVDPVEVPTGLWTEPGRMTQNKWKDTVRQLTWMLQSGIASKVVLTRDIVVSASAPIDERFLVEELSRRYGNTWVYSVEGLIGATPEMLASLRNKRVTSRVLAGTSAPGEGETLLSSLKDRTEHHLAVESVARALGPLSEEMTVPTTPGLLDLPNVTHLATEVTALVPSGNVLDIVDALHPTAAVCGTPTRLAFEILEDIEGTQRGRYTGPVGWVDGSGDGEFGIALRCGQLDDHRMQIRVFAGGGIMPDSVPDLELAETRAKMKPVLEALGIEG